jgi:hypothetical protein
LVAGSSSACASPANRKVSVSAADKDRDSMATPL